MNMKKSSFALCLATVIGLSACGSDENLVGTPTCEEQDVIDLTDEIVKDELKSQLFEAMLEKAGKSGQITYEKALEVRGRSKELDKVIDLVNGAVNEKEANYADIETTDEDASMQKAWCSAKVSSGGAPATTITYTAQYIKDQVYVEVEF